MTVTKLVVFMLLCQRQCKSETLTMPSVLKNSLTQSKSPSSRALEEKIREDAYMQRGSNRTFSELLNILKSTDLLELIDILVPEIYSQIDNEDITLRIDDLIPKNGYPLEKHAVQTEDGYVLNMYRIPSKGSVVFLMHGVPGSADDFILNGPENGLAYLLANDGYDVWLGNARGNKHSRRHRRLSPTDPKFWDFSWHEIGYYDLPAMIDHALKISKKETLKYIGHSQGTTVFFVMAAERTEYNSKVALMVALSPVVYFTNVKSPIVNLLAPSGLLFFDTIKRLGVNELLPSNNLSTMSWKSFIYGVFANMFSNIIIFLVDGFDLGQLNVAKLPIIVTHIPSGSSVKQIEHYNQCLNSGLFRYFDFGVKENVKRYGSQRPPRYSIGEIRSPISLFYSDGDWLAGPVDINKLYNELPNVVDLYEVPYKNFSHLDFVFGKDFKILIYDRLRKLLLL